MNLLVHVQICCKSINKYVSGQIHDVINPQQVPAPLQILHLSICTTKVSAGFLAAVKKVSLNYIIAQKTRNVVIFGFKEQLLNEALFPPTLNHLLIQTST